MDDSGRASVLILGGGMGALTAALGLSEGNWKERFERITVLQRGWRLGGKGASSRGVHGRIEEHGLHVLLGYYDHTFDVLRRCYDELDRAGTDPECPIRTWDQAVVPSNNVGLAERHGDGWDSWVASFSATSDRPGTPLTVVDVAVRSLGLLADFFTSLETGASRHAGTVSLTTSPEPPKVRPNPSSYLRAAGLVGLVAQLSWVQRIDAPPGSSNTGAAIERELAPLLGSLRCALERSVSSDAAARRTHQLAELVTGNLIGIAADRLLTRPEGFGAIDHLDYRQWLAGHGVAASALDSPLVRGMYDLVFAYEDGDPARPRFAAGLGLQLATRMLFGYSGALFWRMRAGMGEVVFAPVYEVLHRRGVEFRFFHRVDALRLTADGAAIDAVEAGVQAQVKNGPDAYQPLIRVKGLPGWPDAPLADQLVNPDQVRGLDVESHWSPRMDSARVTLRAGRDFDAVVFAISVGMVPHICAELVSRSPSWQAMVENLSTVATQSFQLWLRADERAMGWVAPDGVTLSGFAKPFDSWASMSHLVAAEDWPERDRPKTVAYFCGALGPVDPSVAHEEVHDRARQFLDRDVGALWPGAVDDGGFRWDLLCDGDTPPDASPDPLGTQYWRANVDPSDRYVQSLPGTDRFRLRPDGSGFANLILAGDWTDCGLNAGCIEAATLSGQLAAEAVKERIDD